MRPQITYHESSSFTSRLIMVAATEMRKTSVSGIYIGKAVAVALLLASLDSPAVAQREFRVYDSYEYEGDVSLPPDYEVPAEFVSGRLMYPSGGRMGWGRGRWEQGGTSWAVDYPKGDRTFLQLLRRFSTIDARSVEQPVNLNDGDDVYYWPFLMVGLAGYWDLSDEQAAKLRDYLLRGGFLFADSFFDSGSWAGFVQGMNKVFPDRQIVDLSGDHPVFHTVYDIPALAETQIPNMNALQRGGRGYLGDGAIPRWRGIMDDHGRLMVLIAFNNDVADSWQWADHPYYPADKVNLGLRLAVNIAVYTMTH